MREPLPEHGSRLYPPSGGKFEGPLGPYGLRFSKITALSPIGDAWHFPANCVWGDPTDSRATRRPVSKLEKSHSNTG